MESRKATYLYYDHLLFTLYMALITEIAASSKVNIAQYADHTQLYIVLINDDTLLTLNNCLHAVHFCLDLNGLSLNPDKTDITIHTRQDIVIGTSLWQHMDSRMPPVAISTHHIQTESISIVSQ